MLYSKFSNIHEAEKVKYYVLNRSQTKTSGPILSTSHGTSKVVDPNLRPEEQAVKPVTTPVQSQVPIESKG